MSGFTTVATSPVVPDSSRRAPAQQRKRLRELLLEQFPKKEEVARLLDDSLGTVLDHVATGPNLTDICHNLVVWLWVDRVGRLQPFLTQAIQERPNCDDFRNLDEELRLLIRVNEPQAATVPTASQNTVRDAVIRFQERFRERRRLFSHLNAYKQLHDILHDLQDNLEEIKALALKACRPGERFDPTGIIEQLKDWELDAAESATETEFPALHQRWIQNFVRAADSLIHELTKTDPYAVDKRLLDRAIETLAGLPAGPQAELNEWLVGCASQLNTDDFVELMDDILITLGPGTAAQTSALRARVERFRGLCQQLEAMIYDHTLCQRVAGVLLEAAGLPEPRLVTPSSFFQWTDVSISLREMAERHPDKRTATRPAESVLQFEVAATAGDHVKANEVFNRLVERFDHLFFNTDKTLLDVTKDLLSAVEVLDATLGDMYNAHR